MWEILSEIWALPWYKVFIIAVADDAILFVKIWPAWLGLIILCVIIVVVGGKGKGTG